MRVLVKRRGDTHGRVVDVRPLDSHGDIDTVREMLGLPRDATIAVYDDDFDESVIVTSIAQLSGARRVLWWD